jgi:hypothetical protein
MNKTVTNIFKLIVRLFIQIIYISVALLVLTAVGRAVIEFYKEHTVSIMDRVWLSLSILCAIIIIWGIGTLVVGIYNWAFNK